MKKNTLFLPLILILACNSLSEQPLPQAAQATPTQATTPTPEMAESVVPENESDVTEEAPTKEATDTPLPSEPEATKALPTLEIIKTATPIKPTATTVPPSATPEPVETEATEEVLASDSDQEEATVRSDETEEPSLAQTPDEIKTENSQPEPLPPRLASVNSFLYQLQDIDLEAVGQTGYDLVVMDYAANGSGETAFNAAQIEALRNSPGGPKIIISYMSIGESEDYRFYWNPDWDANNDGQPDEGVPSWLDIQNPYWAGNYKVRYWDSTWQAVIFDYTDRLLDAGFDGAYLDIIDAYEYYEKQGRETAAQEMAEFVAAVAAHAHQRNPDFYIFPQNGAGLAEQIPTYLDSVAGIGQEDIYYGYEDDDQLTPPEATTELEGYLDLFKNAGKLVLTVDYATTPAHIDDAYAKSQTKGYVPFVTVRDLDQLTINPGYEPD